MLLLLPLLLPALQEPAAGDLDDLLARARTATPAAVLALADTAGTPESLDEEAWRGVLRERLAGAGGRELLLLGRLLADLDDPGAGALLVGLVEGGDPDLARAALATLELPAFTLDDPVQAALGDLLASWTAEEHPALYAEVARVLHGIGDNARRRAARRYLLAALSSLEPAPRAAAALALARIGETSRTEVLEELETLAQGAGPDADLARVLLERARSEERLRGKVEQLAEELQRLAEEDAGEARGPGDLRILEEIRARIKFAHMEGREFNDEELVAAAADGMLQRLDPHSNFLTGTEFSEFMFDLDPEYGGIGAFVNTVNGLFTIVRPIYSGPAFEAGLRSGDAILEVDGWSTFNQPQDEIIKRLKGKPGTKVLLKVARRGWDEPHDIEIVRRRIEVPVVQSEILPGQVLYLELVHFSSHCGDRLREAIAEAGGPEAIRGIVLDLRNNPGGLLDEAVDVCDVFLPPGKLVVTTRARPRLGGSREFRTRRPAAVPAELPVAVLINHFSASGSEIVAGALDIHDRAVVVGQRSHGKGSVQNLVPLSSVRDEPFEDENDNGFWDSWEKYVDRNGNGRYDYGPRIKLTTAYYYLPDGSTIHNLRDHEGRVVRWGGVQPQPEFRVPFPGVESRYVPELDRLMGEQRFREYARTVLEADREKALALAVYDGRDPLAYPGWEEFYASLDTWLPPDEVRRWVRRNLRILVSDARGRVFAGNGWFGDFVEDPQLLAALREVLRRAGVDFATIPEYATVTAALAAARQDAVSDRESRG